MARVCPVNPHRPTCVSLQGAIFLFFAGRIEAIKGNVDAVSNGVWAGPLGVAQASRKSAAKGHTQGQSQLQGGPEGELTGEQGRERPFQPKQSGKTRRRWHVWSRILTGRYKTAAFLQREVLE